MTECYFRAWGGRLIPEDERAHLLLKGMKPGDILKVEATKARNPGHHRWFFALLKLIGDQTGENTENILFRLKVRLGYVDEVKMRNGVTHLKPRSISYASMDQTEFAKFADDVVKMVIVEFLPGVPEGVLRREIEAILTPREAAHGR